MGYTNYWKPKKLTKEQIPAGFWEDTSAVLDSVLRKGIRLGDGVGENEYKSGKELIDATADAEFPTIVLNGLAELNEDYETFALVFDGSWNFCKTARQPYDLAVKCLLILAEQYDLLMNDDDIRDDIDIDVSPWSFDGDKDDQEYIEAMEIINAYMVSKNNS